MQIVIDIPKDYYKECVDVVKNEKDDFYITKWIANGTPLPKGHGRLVDADELCMGLVECWHTADANAQAVIKDVIADVVIPITVGLPTVLEADKENSDANNN